MRPDYCPLLNEPCQKGCEPKCGSLNAWEKLREENEILRARLSKIERAAAAVTRWDWSDNDDDCVADIYALAKAMAHDA